MAQNEQKVRREFPECVAALKALGPRSSAEHIDDVLDDAQFHLKELMGAIRPDSMKIEALKNLMRKAITLLDEQEASSGQGGV